MGTILLLFCVIYQTVITLSLGGITLPLSDSIGKVTPIKPKPLSDSTVFSAVTSSSLCEDVIPELFTPAAKESVIKEFSSPLALTSSSRALPVPKIDSLSIENVTIPENLKEKFLSVCKAPVRKIKPDNRLPEVSLPPKSPFLSSSRKLSTNSILDMHSASLNKLSPLPSIKSLPHVPLVTLKPIGIDTLSASSKAKQFSALPSISTFPKYSLSTSEAKKFSFGELFTTNTFCPLSSSYSLPYPLHYKSMYLPGVRTPSAPLTYRPIPYKGAGNFNVPRLSRSHNLLTSKTINSDTGFMSLPHINEPYTSPYLNSIKTSQILKPIQIPKFSSNVPVSNNVISSSINAAAENLWPPKEGTYGSATVAFESKIEPSKSVLSSHDVRCDHDPSRFMPTLEDGGTPDFKLRPCTPLTPTSSFLNLPVTPLVPLSPSSPIVDVLSNRISNFDSSKNIDTPNMIPIIRDYKETIEILNPNDLGRNFQTSFDSKNVPSLERINLPSLPSYQHQSFTKGCVSIPQYSPPIIPTEPIATIFSGTSSLSPTTYCSSGISQNPSSITYINQSPSSSIAQSTSNMVSSITNLVSNIVQNILSSYKSYIHSTPQNIPKTPIYTISSNPYADTVLKHKETLSVVPLPQENPVNTISILPITLPIDCIDTATLDSSTIVSLDAPCHLPASETSSSQPVMISSIQLSAPILPPSSLITFSSQQLSPSYLPSPILPSYPVIASPLYMEAPVFKVSSSKKNSDVEKMIELMLLAEILNNDESFDWDDIDTLLAFLSLS